MVAIETIVSQLLTKLADPLISLYEVDDKVELLVIKFRSMQCFLKDADAKQEGDEGVKNWVLNVSDAAYETEDVINNFIFKVAPLKRTGFLGCITRYACIFCELIARYKLSSDIERINNKFRVISESRLALGIKDINQEAAGTSSGGLSFQERRLTSPLDQEPDFVGFEKDLEILVGLLTNGESRRCVVSVVGMGGLGKTTLTKKVYNDTRVKEHFNFCAWICLSQEYDVKDVLKKFIDRNMVLSEEQSKKVEKMDVSELRYTISESLVGMIYLMVVDDIWTNEAWYDLEDAFPYTNNGSRVMLTTRHKDVALCADARCQPYELRFLETDESWELFRRKAFRGQDTGCPQNLEKTGREIVEKCHGLPLAIMVIGGLLKIKETWEWEIVRDSISQQFVQGQPEISQILLLSYKDLPLYLKQCFLYLAIFPEDYEFRAKKLIKLWAAEGFLQQEGALTPEQVGEVCLQELIQRSMIQLASRSSSGGIKSCRMHDLLRDLSISEAKKANFLEIHRQNAVARSTHTACRPAICRNSFSRCASLYPFSTSRLRSLLIHTQVDAGYKWDRMFELKQEKFPYIGFKLLRVLDVDHVAVKELPSEMGTLIHLRYLRCTGTYIKGLPSWIGNLQILQTLIVTSHNQCELYVPRVVEKLQQLRHFQVNPDGMWVVIGGRPRLDLINNLQTLTFVKAGKWMDDCLRKFTKLRKLEIRLDSDGTYDKVFYDSIIELDCLQSLLVSANKFERNFSLPPLLNLRKLCLRGAFWKFPESTKFPANLTKLTLKSNEIRQDPLPTLEKLQNLRILILQESSTSKSGVDIIACSAQGFPQLESLRLEGLRTLEEWTVQEGAMPSLIHLRISRCQRLKMLPEGLRHVTTLKTLELWSMVSDFNERLQENKGEDWHKIRHIPSIDISNH